MVAALCTNQFSIIKNSQIIKSGDFIISNRNSEQMCKDFSEIFLMLYHM